ncbi:hypothetical protein ACH4E8_34550 [Streptomyces sp. NPDC017979]|uniref:hypothetical protein n=1 Tax=Streptomyces sp. NPDC017979 TaxID=3365024 RepID=UPI0037973A61
MFLSQVSSLRLDGERNRGAACRSLTGLNDFEQWMTAVAVTPGPGEDRLDRLRDGKGIDGLDESEQAAWVPETPADDALDVELPIGGEDLVLRAHRCRTRAWRRRLRSAGATV